MTKSTLISLGKRMAGDQASQLDEIMSLINANSAKRFKSAAQITEDASARPQILQTLI